MDIIDKVSYDFEWDNEKDLLEATRLAYISLFNPVNKDAQLVIKHLLSLCKRNDMSEFNDPVMEAKYNALRNVIFNIKKVINSKPIEEDYYE